MQPDTRTIRQIAIEREMSFLYTRMEQEILHHLENVDEFLPVHDGVRSGARGAIKHAFHMMRAMLDLEYYD